MGQRLSTKAMYATVREYLQELQASGVDGLPLVDEAPASQPDAVSPRQRTVSRPETPVPQNLEAVRLLLGDCQRCPLAQSRTNLVFGTGNPKARLLFVGEAPGADEDRQGEPFVGEAGQILTRIIAAMGLSRQDVYICNVLKCRPPANRNPHRDEIDQCAPFLQQQIRSIGPEVIVALGTFAAQTLLHSKEPISKLRGHFHQYQGIPLMPTFHPAFLLRNKESKEYYWEVWRDMELVLKKLKLPVPEKKQKAG